MRIACPYCQKEIDSKYIAKRLGSGGGLTTAKKYGKSHYVNLANSMNAKIKAKKLLKLAI